MSYGLDFSEIRYETDHSGNRLKATIPYPMLSALIEFWIAARRAQTAKIEATSRPGQFKGSLQAAQLPTPDHPAPPPPPASTYDRHWQSLIDRLPAETVESAPIDSSPPEPASSPAVNPKSRRVFYREFVEAPPVEVMERIARGVYFVRAWREYRGLTVKDAAELLGRDKTTIAWHESGKNAPTRVTLEKLAQIYDCPLEQITPAAGSDNSPFDSEQVKPEPVVEAKDAAPKQRRPVSEPRSPAETDYPDAVLAHLIAGKSPMLAWRLYRGMSLKALAEAYGGREGNIKAMEQNPWLRRTTIDKLCPIFHCKPEQLLRPDGMPSTRETIQTQAAAIVSIASADEKKGKQKKAHPKRDSRLARMQAELERLQA